MVLTYIFWIFDFSIRLFLNHLPIIFGFPWKWCFPLKKVVKTYERDDLYISTSRPIHNSIDFHQAISHIFHRFMKIKVCDQRLTIFLNEKWRAFSFFALSSIDFIYIKTYQLFLFQIIIFSVFFDELISNMRNLNNLFRYYKSQNK